MFETSILMSEKVSFLLGNIIGVVADVLFGVKMVSSDNLIFNKLSVVSTLVIPPSKLKYGADPLIILFVIADNAWVLNEYCNNNNGTHNKCNLDNRCFGIKFKQLIKLINKDSRQLCTRLLNKH